MPRRGLSDARAEGVLRIGDGTSNAGPADELLTPIAILATGVVSQESNDGTVVHQVLGDGRQYTPVQSSEPAGQAAGHFFIQEIAGVPYWAFVDSLGAKQLLQPVTILSGVALTDSVPVDVDLVTHAGAVEWLVNINDGADGNLSFRVLGASTGAGTVDYTIQPGTNTIPHTIDVARSAGITRLTITASGAGYTASVRRITLS